MLGFIAVTAGAQAPTSPSIDPATYAHPSRAVALAQAFATDGEAALSFVGGEDSTLARVVIVGADPEVWAPACEDCLRAVGKRHDCTGTEGPVRILEAVLMHAHRVRS